MDGQELTSLSVRELMKILQRRKVDYSDCVEKIDLINRILQTADREPKGPIVEHNVTIGPLSCSTVSNSTNPEAIVVLSHGLGANSEDLLPIAISLVGSLTGKIKFVFPNGPMALPQGGRGWWEIDLQKYLMLAMSGNVQAICQDIPPGFREASQKLQIVIETLSKQHSIPLNKFVIGGFSQGAMMSIDATLKLESPVAALFPWSPGFVNGGEWKALAPSKKGLKVFHTHGTEDPVIPYVLATQLKAQIFDPNNFVVNFHSFKGGHTIPPPAVPALRDFLNQL